MNVNELLGKTLKEVVRSEGAEGDAIFFTTDDGVKYVMEHRQDCCENVRIESVVGDLEDLVGTPILVAEERVSGERDEEKFGSVPDHIWIMAWESQAKKGNMYYKDESSTWTFYTFRTIKGTVDIRWYGSSNGYYSEEVGFYDAI